MEKEVSRNIRIGIVLIITTVLLIIALYIIGDKRNIFGSTFRVSAMFHNVNGLMPGNNVRLSGINVGTVESVEIINDSMVSVSMLLENKIHAYITTSAIASIGTDGLMGNKLVNINSSNKPGRPMKEDDTLQTLPPFETDEMIRTLNTTNENIKYITTDLRKITQKINSPNTLWSLLMDTIVAENVKTAIVNIKVAGDRSATITGDLKSIIRNVKDGNGSIGSLLNDTSFSGKLDYSMTSIQQIAAKMTKVTENLETVSNQLKNGDGVIGTLLTDTSLTNNLSKSMENLKDGTAGFNENMEALKHNILLRRYFKKKNSKDSNNKP